VPFGARQVVLVLSATGVLVSVIVCWRLWLSDIPCVTVPAV